MSDSPICTRNWANRASLCQPTWPALPSLQKVTTERIFLQALVLGRSWHRSSRLLTTSRSLCCSSSTTLLRRDSRLHFSIGPVLMVAEVRNEGEFSLNRSLGRFSL